MPTFTISQIEAAINFWRGRQAAGEDAALCPKKLLQNYAKGLLTFSTWC
jgi:hypothetical protein